MKDGSDHSGTLMRRSTHGGGVVFKLTITGPRYLLVEASGAGRRWVFPKGRVENGETAAAAARREVSEEAGVRARPIRRLRAVAQEKAGERIAIAYFLMFYAGRTTPLEDRRVRWLSYRKARKALDPGKNRRVLRSANRLVWTALVTAVLLAVAAAIALLAVVAV